MYILDYHDNDMNQHKITVYSNDDAAEVANSLAAVASIPPELIDTLTWKIQQEIMKRKRQN